MPVRYLKPGIRDSAHIEDIKSPQAEILYYRLICTVDDFGRFDARPLVIKAQCFPIRESVTVKMISLWLSELQKADMIWLYEVSGAPFLEIKRWDNKPRAVESKFPQMNTDADKRIQTYSGVHEHTDPMNTVAPLARARETVTETVTVTETSAAKAAGFDAFWKAYPKHIAKEKAVKAWGKLDTSNGLLTKILEAVAAQSKSAKWTKDDGEYIPHPATWINQKRWEDEISISSGKDWRDDVICKSTTS